MTIMLPRGPRPTASSPAPATPVVTPPTQGTTPQQQWGHHWHHHEQPKVLSVAVQQDHSNPELFIKNNTSLSSQRPPLRRVPTPLDPSLALFTKSKSAIDTNPSPATTLVATPAESVRQVTDPFPASTAKEQVHSYPAADVDCAPNAPRNYASPASVQVSRAPFPKQIIPAVTRNAQEAHSSQPRDYRDLDSEYRAHNQARQAKPFPSLVTSVTGGSHILHSSHLSHSTHTTHRPHDPRSSLGLDVPVSASSEFDHSYWSTDSHSPASHSSHGHAQSAGTPCTPSTPYASWSPYVPRTEKDASYASDARAPRAPHPPLSAAPLAHRAPGAHPHPLAPPTGPYHPYGAYGPSGSTNSPYGPPDSASHRPKPAVAVPSAEQTGFLKTSYPSPPRAVPVSSSSTPTTPTTSPTTRRRPSFSKSLSNLREHFNRGRSRSFSDQGHEPAASLPPVPRVPSVYLDLATDPPRHLRQNTGGMSLLRKMTKKKEKEAPKVAPPSQGQARNILAEMGAQSEQLRRRPTLPTQPQKIPPGSVQPSGPPSAYQQGSLRSQGSIRSAGARNVLKEMGAASDQIRARPPGSHPGRPGPRSRPRPKRQGTFEAIVVGQLPPQDDDETPAHADALAKLTGEPAIPIRRPPSPGTDSSSAQSTPPEVSLLGLEIDPSALRKPAAIEIDPTALRQPALAYDDDIGLPYDAPVAEKIVLGNAYGSSPSDYGGEDLIDSYLDRSPTPPPAAPLPLPQAQVPVNLAPGQVMPSSMMPGQIMPGQVVREVGLDGAAPDVVENHTRAFLASRGLPDSDDEKSSSDHAAVRPYGSESGHSSVASHMRRAYGSDIGHGSQLSHSASVQSHGSVRRARPEHKQASGNRSRSSSRARHERRDSGEKEPGQGLFRKASQLGRKLSTKHARKWSREMPPLPGPPTSYNASATSQAEQNLERKSCKPTIHTSASLATEISQVRNKDDAAQMEALFLV